MPHVDVPELAINARLYPDGRIPPQRRLEQRIVTAMFAHLATRGFLPVSVDDGECREHIDSAKSAMELIFNLDQAWVRVRNNDTRSDHSILLVMGNGVDIITDYNYINGDPDGFNAAMEAFDVEQYA